MDQVRLKVPASTSNLGPGFDTLGLALDWPLEVLAEKKPGELEIDIEFAGEPAWDTPLKQLVGQAIQAWSQNSGREAREIRLSIKSDIPLARGLGSSATYRLAAAAAANVISGAPLAEPEILKLVCSLERHPDNAVPAMVGGLTVSGWIGDRVHFVRYPVPSRFRFVVLVPDMELSTEKARMALPDKVSRADAVFNMQRAIWMVNAIANDRPEELAGAFEDKLHQPYRETLVPFLPVVIKAAKEAGAFGGFLSGAGSSVIAVCDDDHSEPVCRAMEKALSEHGQQGRSRVLLPDNRGLQVL